MTKEIIRRREEIAMYKFGGSADLINCLDVVGKGVPILAMMAKDPIIKNVDQDGTAQF